MNNLHHERPSEEHMAQLLMDDIKHRITLLISELQMLDAKIASNDIDLVNMGAKCNSDLTVLQRAFIIGVIDDIKTQIEESRQQRGVNTADETCVDTIVW